MKRRKTTEGNFYHRFRLILLLFLLVCIIPFASGSGFSFLDKAKKHYQAKKPSTGFVEGNSHVIDSLLTNKPIVTDFTSASDISWKIGLYLLEQGKHAAALDIFIDMRRFMEAGSFHTIEDERRMSSLLTVTGAIYEETGLWNEALTFYMKSLQLCNQIGYQLGKAKVYNNIGKLYFNRNELGKAEELYNKAIEINKALNIRRELFNNYNNLAGIYKTERKQEKALEYALLALNQLNINSNYYELSIIYNNIGNLYQDIGNTAVAMSYYHQAITIQRRNFYTDALINSLLSIVSLYESVGNRDSAFAYISEAQKAAAQQTSPSQQLMVLKSSALFFTQEGNYRKANEFYTRFLKLNDSLEMLNSLNKIEQIQSVYGIISREKDNKILQQKVNLQQLAIQRQQIVLVVALIIFLFLTFFIISTHRNRKRERNKNELIAAQAETLHQREKEMLIDKEQNLKLEIDYKNRQLTSYALNMARNNEFITKATEQLRQISLGLSSRDKEKSDRIREILAELQQYPSGNDWEAFRLYFEEVHQSFEKNLTSSYPFLSANDKKICALLKLGLSTKDIASITFRELRSVESARNRLRKKLGLAAEVNIHNFLSQF